MPNVLLHVEGSYSNMALFSFQEIIDTWLIDWLKTAVILQPYIIGIVDTSTNEIIHSFKPMKSIKKNFREGD